jgi:hypothetical protein
MNLEQMSRITRNLVGRKKNLLFNLRPLHRRPHKLSGQIIVEQLSKKLTVKLKPLKLSSFKRMRVKNRSSG